jgi:UDP-N-acetylglucosamine--N-acetylmuramyl-(pentapeptide) pyrophosphoryl-undecaprenol N-acetylglucosamine transferase
LVPIPESVSHDQVKNAFSYARSGAAIVIEQQNLTPHILVAEIERLLSDQSALVNMKDAARSFAEPGAATKLAKALLDIALEHA